MSAWSVARRSFLQFLAGVVALRVLVSCGVGTAAVATAAGGDASSNAGPAVTDVQVSATKNVPALISFRLIDAESDPTNVTISYRRPDGVFAKVTLDEPKSQESLATLPSGKKHAFKWKFDTDLDSGTAFHEPGTVVSVSIGDQIPLSPILSGTAAVKPGNDPPSIASEDVEVPSDEVAGIALIQFRVADETNDDGKEVGDTVRVSVEYAIVDASGDLIGGWSTARPAGLQDSEPTPEFAFEAVSAEPTGTDLEFFWDVVYDLPASENRVRIRITANDFGDGVSPDPDLATTVESVPFNVDNNAEPAAELNGAAIVSNPDRRNGIPLPFSMKDDESNNVRLVLQWRRPEQDFDGPELSLPADLDELRQILLDPQERRAKQVCAELPVEHRGIARLPAGAEGNELRLPETATSAMTLAAAGLVGREIDILRSSRIPKPLPASLPMPVAAVPLGDGRTAAVLVEEDASWKVLEVDLATGFVATTVAVALQPGTPTAMTIDAGDGSLFVASDDDGRWRVDSIALGANTVSMFAQAPETDPTVELGPIRGLTTWGRGALLATVGQSLLLIRGPSPHDAVTALFSPSAPRANPLQQPTGIVVDPHTPDRAFVAEQGANRIVELDLSSLAVTRSFPGVPAPQALAWEGVGSQLLVAARPSGGPHIELVILDLGVFAEPVSVAVFDGEADPRVSVASGPDGLRLLALAGAETLAVGGGLEQQHTIVDFAIDTQIARVDATFDPPLGDPISWRVPRFLGPSAQDLDGYSGPVDASPAGRRHVFLWDSRQVPGGGNIFFRLTPVDTELGVQSETGAPISVAFPIDSDPISLAPFEAFSAENGREEGSILAADLDGDGDLDIARTFGCESGGGAADRTVGVYLQNPPAYSFPRSPADPSEPACTMFGVDLFSVAGPDALVGQGEFVRPSSLAAGDLDQDGLVDLVVADASVPEDCTGCGACTEGADMLWVRTQSSAFAGGHALPVMGPSAVVVADLDGDGDLDVASSNELQPSARGTGAVSIFHFEGAPLGPGAPTTFDDFPGAHDLECADVDRDGFLDLVVANASGGTVSILYQAGVLGGRRQELGADMPGTLTGPIDVAIADFDDDGDPDVAVANRPADGQSSFNVKGLVFLFQDERGLFPSGAAVFADPDFFFLGTPEVTLSTADFDGDERQDLLVTNRAINELLVFLQNAPGNLGIPDAGGFSRPSLRFGDADSVVGAAVVDIDEDGGLDILTANRDSATVRIFRNVQPGDFDLDSITKIGGPGQTGNPLTVAVGDLDGNGLLDAVAAGDALLNGIPTLALAFQIEPRVFKLDPATSLGGPGSIGDPVAVALADFDNDGDLDIASADREETITDIVVFEQSTGGEFGAEGNPKEPSLTVELFLPAFDMEAGDLNGDGLVDLVSVQRANVPTFQVSSTIFLNESTAGGAGGGIVFALAQDIGSIEHTNGARGVALGDLDGDGFLDVVTANEFSNDMSAFLQDPVTGTFGAPTVPDGNALPHLKFGSGAMPLSSPYDAVIADLNGDGRADIASADRQGFMCSVFLQSADSVSFGSIDGGGFLPSQQLSLPCGSTRAGDPSKVVAADFDGDGDTDLLTVNTNVQSLTIFEQIVPGRFELGLHVFDELVDDILCCPQNALAVDMDSDGEIDLVSANSGSCRSLTVFYNAH